MVKELDQIKVENKELTRDDFIEYILKNTEDGTTFRVHETKIYINVGIDRPPKEEE